VTSDTIHFDTDRFNVDAQSQAILQSQAQWLARYPNKRVTIEGHCDERGTRDYNLALGERRANAAKNLSDQPGYRRQPHQHRELWQGTPDRAGFGRSELCPEPPRR
jgi:flagellar motor protein MotB